MCHGYSIYTLQDMKASVDLCSFMKVTLQKVYTMKSQNLISKCRSYLILLESLFGVRNVKFSNLIFMLINSLQLHIYTNRRLKQRLVCMD
jgi:hypothetical protein